MVRLPKYRSIPRYALKYAERTGKLTLEHEKVFANDPKLAVEYCIKIKRGRATPFVESSILNYFCKNKLKYDRNPHLDEYRPFFHYVHMIGQIPNDMERQLLENLDCECLVKYANSTEKRLPQIYEDKLLETAIKDQKCGILLEYFCALGTKLPENMHNFMIGQALSSNNTIPNSYIDGLKNIKRTLIQISKNFDKNITIQELINQF